MSEEVKVHQYEIDEEKIKTIEDVVSILKFIVPAFTVKDELQLNPIINLIKKIN